MVIGEINSLVASESLAVVPGVKVEVVLGGYYKVSIHVYVRVHTLAECTVYVYMHIHIVESTRPRVKMGS